MQSPQLPKFGAQVLQVNDSTPKSYLKFERGTVALTFGDGVDQYTVSTICQNIPTLTWDTRSHCYRCPASDWIFVRQCLKSNDMLLNDEIAPLTKRIDGDWDLPSLMPHQMSALKTWEELKLKRGVVCLPTGAGKTMLAMHLMQDCALPTLILVPTRVLMHQWIKILKGAQSNKVGQLGDGIFKVQSITVATYQSAFLSAARIGNLFALVVLDEAHHFGNGVMDELFAMLTAPWRLALTATLPTQVEHLQKFNEIFGPVIHNTTRKELLGTVLAPFRIETTLFQVSKEVLSAHKSLMAVWTAHKKRLLEKGLSPSEIYKLSEATKDGKMALGALLESKKCLYNAPERFEAIQNFVTLNKERRILIFTPDANTAYNLSLFLLVPAITAEIGPNERNSYLAAFGKGKLNCLISCKVLNEGYDLPDAEMAILVAPQSSARDLVQRVGRVLRKKENKIARVQFFICEGSQEQVEVNRCKKTLLH